MQNGLFFFLRHSFCSYKFIYPRFKHVDRVSRRDLFNIFFIADQDRSTAFYTKVLSIDPRLYVPGMTEFSLPGGGILGLMPVAGIRKLLGDTIPDPGLAAGIPRSELYLLLHSPEAFHARALAAGLKN